MLGSAAHDGRDGDYRTHDPAACNCDASTYPHTGHRPWCGTEPGDPMIIHPAGRCDVCDRGDGHAAPAAPPSAAHEGLDGGYEALRATFLGFLTVDSETQDRRRRDYNQAIFLRSERSYGEPVWSRTTLDMVMDKFDKAVKAMRRDAP